MIDWVSRIDDLMHALQVQHAVTDRLAVETLLSCLIDCPRTCSSWIILETPWQAPDFENGWFSLGGSWMPVTLRRLRGHVIDPRTIEEARGWLDHADEPRLFIEPEYEIYPATGKIPDTRVILARSLRIRTRTPRTASPLRELDARDQHRQNEQIKAFAKAAIEDRARARSVDPPKFIEPPNFLAYAEMLQRLAPWYRDWRLLLISLATIAIRHAYLHGLAETGPAQNALLARIACDSIPPWIARAMRLLLEREERTGAIAVEMQLPSNKKGSQYSPHREIERLLRNKVIGSCSLNRSRYLYKDHRKTVELLLEGRAFGMLASCA